MKRIGAAIGGVLVHPAHNLHYVEGTFFWAGVPAQQSETALRRVRAAVPASEHQCRRHRTWWRPISGVNVA